MELSRFESPLQNCGAGFTLGLIGGGVFHGAKGAKISPKGLGPRFASALANAKTASPRVGGNFAAWGFTFSLCNDWMIQWRQKDDWWNNVLSAASSGFIMNVRRGMGVSVALSLTSATVFALFEVARYVVDQIKDKKAPHLTV